MVEVQILTSPHSTSYKSVVFVIDSITTNFGQEARPIEITVDSVDYTRVLSLSPNHSVMFDYGISTLDFRQRLVIDETDTLDFKDTNRLNVGGNYMSKLYVFSVIPEASK